MLTESTVADVEVARTVAETAGRVLLRERWSGALASAGSRGDRAAQAAISGALGDLRPDDLVLSEEAVDDPARLSAPRVWIVDPLDGTREFAEGRADWAVHVALWADGELVAGAVALPALGVTLSSDSVEQVGPASASRPRIAISRTRPPAAVHVVAEALSAELVPMGSAGYKAAAVVRGEVDAYVHAGGQYEWDSAAPVAVARAAGLHTSRLDGSPLRYNRPDLTLPDLVICRPELAGTLLDLLADEGVRP